ncbi:hypothetical protein BH10PSE2_BH10PSE2_07170 [soil metagenome]
MRDFKGMKRQRGRNRKPGGGPSNANNANPNRSWDSQGPENIKVRGNAQTVYERYQQLGRDATAAGDRVLAENYLQHAEHYFRVLRALQPQRPVSEIAARELSNQGYDIDFEDETGAQAAAFMAAQQAADRAGQGNQGGNQSYGDRSEGEGQNRDQGRDQTQNQNRNEGGQPREWRDRDNSRDRDRETRDRDNRDRDNTRDRDQAPRVEGEAAAEGEGGPRRETRRERWERRREERNRRFEAEGGIGEAPDNAPFDAGRDSGRDGNRDSGRDSGRERDGVASTAETVEPAALAGTPYEPAADDVAPAKAVKADKPRRTRMPRENDADDGPSALPGFLTRSSAAPVAAVPVETPVINPSGVSNDGEPAAPRKRATRRKAETPAADD